MDYSCKKPAVYMVSACLVGLATRYDGRIVNDLECLDKLCGSVWIPFCPEQLGGLPTPRPAADIVGGDGHDVIKGKARIVTQDGDDLSGAFLHGAQQVLQIAQAQQVDTIFLKARSPSCGLTPRLGVTAALLVEYGFRVEEF